MPDWLAILKAYVDTLEAAIGAIEGGTTLHNKLTAARAALLDQITAARMGELDPANIPADIDTLLTRLSALRAGYLDNLSAGAVALASVCTAVRLGELDAANIPADIDTLLTRVTAAVALASVCTEVRLAELAAANLPADIDTLLTRLSAVRAGYLDELDFDLAAAIAAIPTTMVGTNNAALAASWTAALATALGNYTAVRAGYLDELAAANLPTDVANVKSETALIKTQTDKIAGKMLFSMDFWSDPVEEKVVTNAQVTAAVGAAVVVADLPGTATIVRAIVMMKFRMVENTNVAENSLDCDAVQPIQVDDSGNTGWLTAIDFVDEMFKMAAETREGGDILIGDNNVAARVDGNDTYDFQWLNAKAHLGNIQFNDIQMGIRIWYSI